MPIPIADIKDYTDAYGETVNKLIFQAGNQQFTDTLRSLIETHLSQIRLLAGQPATPPANTQASVQDLLQQYPTLVQSICPNAFYARNTTPPEKAMYVLIRTQIFQIGIFGGLQIPNNWHTISTRMAIADGYEDNDGLKRCPDGSLVPHGVSCP